MKYDGTTFGIIPDTFPTILSNYLTPLVNTFPNANSPDSPIYTLAYVTSTQDLIIQNALQSLWNAINANTAQGLGLDILSNTVLNLTRKNQTPSYTIAQLSIGPIYSSCIIQLTITSGTGTLPTGWTVTGGVSTTSPYIYRGTALSGLVTGVYYILCESLDTSTAVPASNFTGGSSFGSTVFTVTNLQPAVLGSITIPTTYQITASSLGSNSPIYSPSQNYTFTIQGIYNILVYSNNITVEIGSYQLNSSSDSSGTSANYLSYITNVFNPYNAILGTPIETDTQFSLRRKYYLNVQGQTYYGMEKAILDLNISALKSMFIAETISDSVNYSFAIIKIIFSIGSIFPVTIPVNWNIIPSSGTLPFPSYHTLTSYNIASAGTYYIPVYTSDVNTQVGIGLLTIGDTIAGAVHTQTNLDPAILGGGTIDNPVPNGLGQRGYTIYLDYPILYPESFLDVIMNVSAITGAPVTIPTGWQVTGFSTTQPYKTLSNYIIPSTGNFTIRVYSTDLTTHVPAASFTGGDAVTGLTFTITQPEEGILGGGFDINDPNLQEIANTAYTYHALGTQFYPASIGATTFTVNTPYPGYTYDVILNPFQIEEITCDLQFVYNSDPNDAGETGIFDISLLADLKTQLLELINNYFLSKTQPTDLVYTITELSEIIQNTYTGITALVGNSPSYFSFGIVSPSSSGHVFLRRLIGTNFNLTNANFNFVATNKDLF